MLKRKYIFIIQFAAKIVNGRGKKYAVCARCLHKYRRGGVSPPVPAYKREAKRLPYRDNAYMVRII